MYKSIQSFLIISLPLVMNLSTAFAATNDWGGKHISLSVTNKKATIQFDCANGSSSNWVVKKGKISATGSQVTESGGSIRPGQPAPTPFKATYSGTIEGDIMKLKVTTKMGTEKFELRKGANAELFRCL